jgi:hypothetical protein
MDGGAERRSPQGRATHRDGLSRASQLPGHLRAGGLGPTPSPPTALAAASPIRSYVQRDDTLPEYNYAAKIGPRNQLTFSWSSRGGHSHVTWRTSWVSRMRNTSNDGQQQTAHRSDVSIADVVGHVRKMLERLITHIGLSVGGKASAGEPDAKRDRK